MVRKSHNPAHLELRYKTYFAVLYVPRDVRFIIGKTKFSRSTETGNLRTAEQRASAFVLGWKAEILSARHEAPDPIVAEALDLYSNLIRKDISSTTVEEIIEDRENEIRLDENPYKADEFKLIATGKKKALSALVPAWKNHQISRRLAEKTIDQMTRDIGYLTSAFDTTNLLNKRNAKIWIQNFAKQNNLSASSVIRIISSCRNFYEYLKIIEEVPENEINPFLVPIEFKKSKSFKTKDSNKTVSWIPFEENDVVNLHKSALNNKDQILADLIFIGAYTGARIEEICSLKCENINLQTLSFEIVEAKTQAGIRQIPIHTKLEKLIRRLITESIDGYLLSALTFSKYQGRSNAIGKRFGRLKNKAGFGKKHVFHSIRKTFTTKIENALVNENITADLIGHEKPNMTYGIYSSGAFLEVKRSALEKISYNFSE